MIFFAVTCVAHGPYRHPKQHESKKQVVLLVQCAHFATSYGTMVFPMYHKETNVARASHFALKSYL
jgi:hypothetical protein